MRTEAAMDALGETFDLRISRWLDMLEAFEAGDDEDDT
jgi:hypothetical protein